MVSQYFYTETVHFDGVANFNFIVLTRFDSFSNIEKLMDFKHKIQLIFFGTEIPFELKSICSENLNILSQ